MDSVETAFVVELLDTAPVPLHPTQDGATDGVRSGDLVAVLDALGIPYEEIPGAGIRVALDAGIDGRLESLIGRLSDLRWGYTPGRAIQVELPGLAAIRGSNAHRSP